MKISMILGAALAAMTFAQAADASHNRGSALIPTIDAQGNLTIAATSFWRTSFVDEVNSVTITGPSGSFSLSLGTPVEDTSDSRFTRVDEVGTTNITNRGAGLYTISWGTCCRVGGTPNTSSSASAGTTSTIFWDGTNATSPIVFDIQNIQPNLVRGVTYSDNLDVTSPNGNTISYDDSVLTVGISAQAPGYTISSTGQITIPGAVTSTYLDNASNIGADMAFSGQINATNAAGQRVGSVQFDWLFDAVAAGANAVPDVVDVVINAVVGDMINTNITATDPNGDPVTLTLLGFNGPGGAIAGANFIPGTPDSPVAGNFTWNSAGFAVGTYIATIRGTDGLLSDQGTITINLRAPTTATVPLPASFLLLGGALAGFGALRRRNKRA